MEARAARGAGQREGAVGGVLWVPGTGFEPRFRTTVSRRAARLYGNGSEAGCTEDCHARWKMKEHMEMLMVKV